MDGFVGEVQALREAFAQKLKVLEQQQHDMRARMSASNQEAATGLAEQRRKHEKEMEQAIQEANERYNQMLLEQLRVQQDLQAKLEEQLQHAVAGAEEAGKLLLEQKIGHLRAELAGEKQEAIMATRREYEEKLQVFMLRV